MPKVSIIVPVYKTEEKLARCIHSILDQTYKDFELILVDDGSPDRSGVICDDFAMTDCRIQVIHQMNSGAAAARNHGIEVSQGEYIGFVDSDDFVCKNNLEALISTIEKCQTDIAVCGFYQIKENDNRIEMSHGFREGTVFGRDEIENIMYRNIFENKHTIGYFSLWNKLFSRKLILENNIRIHSDMSFGEDLIFILDCLKYCKGISFTENMGYCYEMTESGLFSRYQKNFINDISICYREIIKQTVPYNCKTEELIPISVKYWNYINRQIGYIVQNEKNKFSHIWKMFKDHTVCQIFSKVAEISNEQAKEMGIAQNDLKSARLLRRGYVLLAAIVADYQFNPNFWLRRMRH